jgi:zinc transporter ZupT
VQSAIPYVLAFAVAGFLYVALSDLLPALHQHNSKRDTIFQTTFMAAGAIFMGLAHKYLG